MIVFKCWRRTLRTLALLEKQFQTARTERLDPMLGWPPRAPHLTPVAQALAAAYHADADRLGEPAYHDRHHVSEAVEAMIILTDAALEASQLSRELANLGILAMLGHDLGHDGSLASPGHLEAIAVSRVTDLAQTLTPVEQDVLRQIILATAPDRVPANLARARTPQATPLDLLAALANEADVLASLLPELGCVLTHLLAEEWQPHDAERAAQTLLFSSRGDFLSIYAEPTLAARSLGLDECIRRQREAITPELDTMPRDRAMARYRARLAGWASG